MLDFSICYSFTYLDVILISETFTYDDMNYICRIVDFKTFPFEEGDVLKTYIKNQIEPELQAETGNKKINQILQKMVLSVTLSLASSLRNSSSEEAVTGK